MRRFVLLAGALVACSSSQPATTSAPKSVEPSAAEAETNGELAGALRREGLLACARACARLTSCTSPQITDDCHDDCVNVLGGDQAAPAVRYAACVDGLSCEQIEKSMTMGMGPVGLCYVEAQRMAR